MRIRADLLMLIGALLLVGPPGRALWADAPITGASLDERQARATIAVTPATLRRGMQRALDNLRGGVATRVVFRPGVYRQDLSALVWDTGKARDTLLILEGTPGKSVWSGADVFPLSSWRRRGALLVHDWPASFGNYAPFWGPPRLIAHRREMAFVGGDALRPEVLETYKIGGLGLWDSQGVTYDYRGLRDPRTTLTPGTFGVTERPENGRFVFLRPAAPGRLTENSIELSLRPRALKLGAKRNVVLRGLDFVRFATPMPGADPDAPVTFSGDGGTARPGNVLVDRCRFLWNSGSALTIAGTNWTVRDSTFNYNGLSGISTSGDCANVVFDGCETSFNCWRAWRGGENDWSFGGVKMHGTDGQLVRRHTALGNCSTGLWWDVYCGRVDVTDSVSLANANADLKWELSQGPFHGLRLVLGGSKVGDDYVSNNVGDSLLEDSVVYHDFDNPRRGTSNDFGAVATLLSYKRDDPHGLRHVIPRGVYGLKNCLLVAGPRTPLTVRAEWWGDDPVFHFRPLLERNTFAAPGRAPSFQFHLSESGGLVSADYAAFALQAHDVGGRVLDPGLRDPAHFDFRLRPNSPLYAGRARWPQFALPDAKRREMQAFFAWLRVGPDGPALPPAGEP